MINPKIKLAASKARLKLEKEIQEIRQKKSLLKKEKEEKGKEENNTDKVKITPPVENFEIKFRPEGLILKSEFDNRPEKPEWVRESPIEEAVQDVHPELIPKQFDRREMEKEEDKKTEGPLLYGKQSDLYGKENSYTGTGEQRMGIRTSNEILQAQMPIRAFDSPRRSHEQFINNPEAQRHPEDPPKMYELRREDAITSNPLDNQQFNHQVDMKKYKHAM